MSKRRKSWAKVGGITAIACAVAVLYFGCLRAVFPAGGFIRDLVGIIGVGLVGCIFSLSFTRASRQRFLNAASTCVVVLLIAAVSAKLWLKDELAVAFGPIVLCQNRLAPGYEEPHDTEMAKYWRNY